MTENIKPCPFCGSSASVEEVSNFLSSATFSVGCDSEEEASCMGYQSLTSFARRSDAIEGWNKRAPERAVSASTEHLDGK